MRGTFEDRFENKGFDVFLGGSTGNVDFHDAFDQRAVGGIINHISVVKIEGIEQTMGLGQNTGS